MLQLALRMLHVLLALVAFTSVDGQFGSLDIEQHSLRAEARTTPQSLSTAKPRLSWRLTSTIRGDHQSAYHIQVASSRQLLDEGVDLWDSGPVRSSAVNTVYAGQPLRSRYIGWWRVRAWDAAGRASAWSDVTTFELGLLNPSDWTADWIANTRYQTGNTSLPMFAKAFTVDCPIVHARLYLVGLGLHAAQINGEDVTSNLLSPGYNTYSKTVTYDAYNVSNRLTQGLNVIGVELGKGAYDAEAAPSRYMKWTTSPVQLKLMAQLEYSCSNGSTATLRTDATWQSTVSGPRLESSWFGGEEFDARKVIPNWSSPSGDRSDWDTVNTTTDPGGALTASHGPGLAVVETIKAVSVQPVGSSYVFDFGVNFAGRFRLTVKGCPAGRRLVLWPSEKLTSAGLADQSTTGSPIFDGYTCSGRGTETTYPQFMYHGFRFLQLDHFASTPALSDMVGQVIRQNNERVGSVETSSSLLNHIHTNIDRSIQSNSYSVLTDCPHREKLGWLEETHLVYDAVSRGYDIQAWSKDIVRVIADAQTSGGLIPDIAPEFQVFSGGYRDEPNWGSAGVMLPLKLYQNYGEVEVLSTYYTAMQAYITYLTSLSGGTYLLNYGLGDWANFDPCTPVGVTATFGYQQAVQAMVTIATAIGRTSDAAAYSQLQANIRKAFHAKYFDTSSNASYSCGSQASNALALDMGAVPAEYVEAVTDTLVVSLRSNGHHVTVGEIALPSLFRCLAAAHRHDVLFDMMTVTSSPSYGYQVVNGATSLWEYWDGVTGHGSLNHFMLGYGDTWIAGLSGIQQADTSIAWRSIALIPVVVGNLTGVRASYRTPNGVVSAAWSKTAGLLTYDVLVPVGSTAQVVLNGTSVTEGGAPPAGRPGVLSVTQNGSMTTVVVGCGLYHFAATSGSELRHRAERAQ